MSDAEPVPEQVPGTALVVVRVYAACLGWGMLAGVVLGAAYLGLSLWLDNAWDGAGGIPLLVGAVYGGPVGLVCGAVLGLGAVAGSLVGLRAQGDTVGRPVWLARAGFLLTAAVVLLLWRYAFGGAADNWTEWRLVLVVALGLAFGTWRAGRAVRRAVIPAAVPVRAPQPRPRA